MPFGLTNTPTVFQQMMNDIFREYLDQFMVVYLDDILIYSRDLDIHEQYVRLVLSRLREHSLYAKDEKCAFEQSSIEFLGYIIPPDGISMDQRKVVVIQEWKPPTQVRDAIHTLNRRQARWSIFLAEYDFEIAFHPGHQQ